MWRKISNVNFTHRFYVKLEQISHTANIIGSNFRSLVWRVDKQNKHIDTTCHVTKEIKRRKSHQKKQRWKTFPLHITGHAKSPNTKNRNTNRDGERRAIKEICCFFLSSAVNAESFEINQPAFIYVSICAMDFRDGNFIVYVSFCWLSSNCGWNRQPDGIATKKAKQAMHSSQPNSK